ncbi:hypothetical protein AAX26_01597 [Aliarcobacter thereius]|nr:hypothetical protein AAX26_01597 [Aliarcobacter thereius]SUV14762.1 Uncharacterised protein [Aliarcobacter skirrowii]
MQQNLINPGSILMTVIVLIDILLLIGKYSYEKDLKDKND